MKKLLLCLVLICLPLSIPVLTGCKAPTQKQTVNTLFTLHKSVDATLNGYLDLVIQHTVKTNGVPRVLKAYGDFQVAYNAALSFVAWNTNAMPTSQVVAAAATFSQVVTDEKGRP